jgi:hypothetical protein
VFQLAKEVKKRGQKGKASGVPQPSQLRLALNPEAKNVMVQKFEISPSGCPAVGPKTPSQARKLGQGAE